MTSRVFTLFSVAFVWKDSFSATLANESRKLESVTDTSPNIYQAFYTIKSIIARKSNLAKPDIARKSSLRK
jgi:hypothetical protein